MKNSNRILTLLMLAALCACGKTESAAIPTVAIANANSQQISSAGPKISRNEPLNAAPLGVEVGYANFEGVRTKFSPLTKLEDGGINKFTGGPMLISNGEGVGLDGLSKLVFVFDKGNILSAVLMTMPKNPVDVFEKLSGKYRVIENRIEKFMNYGGAKLEKGETTVVIEAAHLSFEMSVSYLTKKLAGEFARQSDDAAKQKRQEQTSKL